MQNVTRFPLVALTILAGWLLTACPVHLYTQYFNPCDGNENCPPGESCLDNICYAIGSGDLCTDDTDCTVLGEVCSAGACTFDVGGGGDGDGDGDGDTCSDHDDCARFCNIDAGLCVGDDPKWGTVYVEEDFWDTAGVLTVSDLEAIKGYNTIVGNLYIGSEYFESDGTGALDIDTIDLGNIQYVLGDFKVVFQHRATKVVAPNLEEITGAFEVDGNNTLSEIDFPALTTLRLDARVDVTENRQLQRVNLPALTQSSQIFITSNGEGDGATIPPPLDVNLGSLALIENLNIRSADAGVSGLNLGALTTVTGDVTLNVEALTGGVSLPLLTQVTGDLEVDAVSMTGTDAAFPALTNVGGDFDLDGLSGMTMLSAPLLATIGGGLKIRENDTLTAFDFSALTSALTLNFSYNDTLDSCLIEALIVQVGLPPADVTNQSNLGNPDDCP